MISEELLVQTAINREKVHIFITSDVTFQTLHFIENCCTVKRNTTLSDRYSMVRFLKENTGEDFLLKLMLNHVCIRNGCLPEHEPTSDNYLLLIPKLKTEMIYFPIDVFIKFIQKNIISNILSQAV